MAQWVRTLDISKEFQQCKNNEISVQQLASKISEKLVKFKLDDYTLNDIIEGFQDLSKDEEATEDDFDNIMEDLYNWADTKLDNEWNGKKNCWVNTF